VLEEISLSGPSLDADTVQYDVGSAGTVSLGGKVSGLTSTVSYSGIENLRLGTSSATAAHKGIGNGEANALTGNAAANKLYGLGGDDTVNGGGGADTLVGGAGNDSYTVDNAGDLVSELSSEGSDRVNTSLNLTLAANVEHLTLTGSTGLKGTGNGSANALTGNSGANLLTGLGGNDTLDGGGGADTLVGGLGNDSYAVNQSGDVIKELAGEGSDTVLSSVSWTLGSTLEHLTLTGNATLNGKGNALSNRLTGNAANNTLTGLDGNDTLDGGGGFNTLVGGLGNDSYLNVGWDTVSELASQGTDTVLLDKSFYTSAYVLPVNVENATKAIDSADDYGLTGNDSANVLTGSARDEQLYGGLGNDTLVGHGGSDRYNLDNPGDVVVEAAGEGASDTVWAAFTITLAANVENLYLTDYDGRANTHGTGNASDNHISGDDGDNLLNGAGGNDRLEGGYGNDTYVVDSAGDTVIESGFYGVDTVKSAATFTLGSYIENLTLTGSGNINGTGNELRNTIIGNSGANKLNGGYGADTMTGGAGNDTYWYDDFADDGVELPNQGTDTLVCQLSDVAVTLDENFENLTMSGSGLQIANGNAANNVLIGSADASSNQLQGGAGNDKLTGGAGAINYFLLDSLIGSDTITNFKSATDGLRILQSGVAVGDGDELVEGAVQVSGPGGFAATAEVVVVTGNISGTLTTSSAAAKIGSAGSAYAAGRKAVFAVDNGEDTALYLFTAVDANATVSAAELKLLALLDGTSSITTADLWFGA
jgi:serralysin